SEALDARGLPPATRAARPRCAGAGHRRERQARRRAGFLRGIQPRFFTGAGARRDGRLTAVGVMMRAVALFLLRFYKRFLSPLLPPMCRFEPTCSVYTMQAVDKYGALRGIWL